MVAMNAISRHSKEAQNTIGFIGCENTFLEPLSLSGGLHTTDHGDFDGGGRVFDITPKAECIIRRWRME